MDSINKINVAQINKYERVISKMDSIVLIQKLELENKRTIIENQKIEINSKDKEITSLNKEISRQKRNKVIAIICGSITTAGSLYLWLTK